MSPVTSVASCILDIYRFPISARRLHDIVFLSDCHAMRVLGDVLFPDELFLRRGIPVTRPLLDAFGTVLPARGWRLGPVRDLPDDDRQVVVDAMWATIDASDRVLHAFVRDLLSGRRSYREMDLQEVPVLGV